jgi:hypothetical protein
MDMGEVGCLCADRVSEIFTPFYVGMTDWDAALYYCWVLCHRPPLQGHPPKNNSSNHCLSSDWVDHILELTIENWAHFQCLLWLSAQQSKVACPVFL